MLVEWDAGRRRTILEPRRSVARRLRDLRLAAEQGAVLGATLVVLSYVPGPPLYPSGLVWVLFPLPHFPALRLGGYRACA